MRFILVSEQSLNDVFDACKDEGIDKIREVLISHGFDSVFDYSELLLIARPSSNEHHKRWKLKHFERVMLRDVPKQPIPAASTQKEQ
jgi:hypothetical protein